MGIETFLVVPLSDKISQRCFTVAVWSPFITVPVCPPGLRHPCETAAVLFRPWMWLDEISRDLAHINSSLATTEKQQWRPTPRGG